ncbi:propionate CoA-transferase [Arcanobacterium pluranimalium]|uniref:CoA-transferase n=1 Tax=Arcanobacterium pluranimalium TaxID=108028 RepID=UPI001958F3D9|nr:CoA-transferase [Arcanobacterium pluranimalium]MBM7825548.1 propionate CoA-transferase [Arcanobacterium pluranimalium]
MSFKQVEPHEVAGLIPNGATVVGNGFTMMGVADEIYFEIEKSFLSKGVPNQLTFVHAAGQSNRIDGLARLAHPGLLKRVIGPHWGLNPPMANVLGADEVEAICLPQGQISTLYRTIAAHRPGQLSTVGLGTFIDPRHDGGRINDSAKAATAPDEYVSLMELDGKEYLFYKSFPLDVAIIRGSRIDPDGNMSQEDDVTILDNLAIAQAVHNNGGIVIAQVKEIVERGDIPAREVEVPGVLVDYVMVTSDPAKYHRQTNASIEVNWDLLTGYASPEELGEALLSHELEPTRIAIGERGAKLVRDGDIINLGTGLPGDSIGRALAVSGQIANITLTVESGTYGGVPLGVVDFGCALHPAAIIGHPQQFDFYNGGGVDITFMGVGQVDGEGNINVSAFAGKAIGCGGFMDIVDGAKRICFLMVADSRHPKWVPEVDQLTFYGKAALDKGQEVYLATEHYLVQLTEDGWKVLEVDDNDAARAAASQVITKK